MGRVNVKIEQGEVLEPLGQMIVVKVDKPEGKIGNIVLPETAQVMPQRGIVVNVGRGRQLDNGEYETIYVRAGDTVIFTQYYGFDEIEITDGELHLLVRQQDIIAKIGRKELGDLA